MTDSIGDKKHYDLSHDFIRDEVALRKWAEQTKVHKWIAFDTEFIGEKRFITLVCLIQVATPDGLFLIDPLEIKDLSPFLDLISNPTIVKITHAGENDYRLLFQNYGTQPRNLVDTQLASGFLSEQYPVNFKRLVDVHLGISLKKGFAVVDWTRRPIQKDALKYALEDVVYLRDMFDVVTSKLRSAGRYDWFMSQMKTWEDTRAYDKTLLDEVKSMSGVYKMRTAEKVFFIRLLGWRRDLAEHRDHSREMVMQTKDINAVTRLMRNGRKAFMNNRHLKSKSWIKHLDMWEDMYRDPPTDQEKEWLKELQAPEETDMRQEIVGEILYKYLSYHCIQEEIAIDLVVPRAVMRDLRTGNQDKLNELSDTWRSEFLGEDVLTLLGDLDRFEPVLEGKSIRFSQIEK